MNENTANVDPAEVSKFNAMASRWWDPDGEFKPLHELNPLRFSFIADGLDLRGKNVVDIGCGGGILTESLALAGADATGIDMAADALAVARLHARASELDIDYQHTSASDFLKDRHGQFDLVTCMELLEHVPDPALLVDECAQLLKPGGQACFSTINRTFKAYALAVVGAEYVLRLLPRGTHDYQRFIKPSELATAIRKAGLEITEIKGLRYDPLTGIHALSDNTDVNYVMRTRKPE